MENEWEYDYSSSYPKQAGGGNPTPASYTPMDPAGEPSMGAGSGTDYTNSRRFHAWLWPLAPMGGEPSHPAVKKSYPRLKGCRGRPGTGAGGRRKLRRRLRVADKPSSARGGPEHQPYRHQQHRQLRFLWTRW